MIFGVRLRLSFCPSRRISTLIGSVFKSGFISSQCVIAVPFIAVILSPFCRILIAGEFGTICPIFGASFSMPSMPTAIQSKNAKIILKAGPAKSIAIRPSGLSVLQLSLSQFFSSGRASSWPFSWTYPPSQIALMRYFVLPNLRSKTGAPKPTLNTFTATPSSFATIKCPSS